MGLDQKWLADGSAVLVLDQGTGEPGDENYAPALVARLATEYHEPGQVLDADPLVESAADGPTATGSGVPGELRGAVAPAGAATRTPGVVSRSTATDDPNVTAPGSPAAVGGVTAAQIITALRNMTPEERAELEAFDTDPELDAAPADLPTRTEQTAGTPLTEPGGQSERTTVSPEPLGASAEPAPPVA